MTTTHVMPVGTSEPQDFALTDAGIIINGTGIEVALEIAQRVAGADVEIETPPSVAWLVAEEGTVRITGAELLPVGIYFMRFELTDLGGAVGYIPNRDSAILWRVVPVLGAGNA